MHLDMSKFKKIKEDHHSATLQHPGGHQIKIAKKMLSPKFQEDLAKLPMHLNQGTPDAPVGDESSRQPTIIINNGQPQNGITSDQLLSQVQNAGPQASMPPAQAAPPSPNYVSNGDFDWNKFYLQNQDVPVETKLNTLDQENKSETFQKQSEERMAQQGADQRAKIIEYNEQAAVKGLPLLPVPEGSAMDMPSASPVKTSADLPSTHIEGQDTPIIAQPKDQFGLDQYGQGIESGIREKQQGIQSEAKALGEEGKAKAETQQTYQNQLQKVQQDYQSHLAPLDQEYQSMLQDYKNKHLDPQHYFRNMNTGQKIATSIGLILGGLGGGLTHQENPVMKFINSQIDRDIDSQQAEIGKFPNLLNANLHQHQNLRDATDMTKAMMMGITASKLEEASATAMDPLAKARALQASGQLQFDAAQLRQQIAMRKAMFGSMTGGGGAATGDPAQFLNVLRLTNPELAKSYEQRYVPQVGVASVPVPDKVREEMVTRQSLDKSVADLEQFAKKHSGTVADRAVVNEGAAKASLVQDMYRRANGQGVFREAEKDFVQSIIGQDPTAFFNSWRTQPRYRALAEDNLRQLNTLKQGYGLPVPYVPKTAKPYMGKK